MSQDYITIGSAPVEEDCASVGEPGYARQARAECVRFIEAIRQALGPEPEGADLRMMGFDHDFGRYYEVCCWYDTIPPSVTPSATSWRCIKSLSPSQS